MTRRHKSRLSGLLVVLVFTLLAPATSSATTIALDPGPLGQPPFEYDVFFSDLNGTAVGGQPLTLDIVFADEKWILTYNLHHGGGLHHGALLMLQTTNVGPFIPAHVDGTAFFADADGNSLNGSIDLFFPGGFRDDGLLVASLYADPLDGPFTYYGLHYDLTLPTMAGHTITGARLRFIDANLVSVPEPGSLMLFGLGALGLLAKRKRRIA